MHILFFEVHFHCFKCCKVSVAIGQSGDWFVVKYWYHCLYFLCLCMWWSRCTSVLAFIVGMYVLIISSCLCPHVGRSLSLWLRCVLCACARGRTIIEIKRKEKTNQRVNVTQTSLKSCDVLFYPLSSTPPSSSSSSPRITRSIRWNFHNDSTFIVLFCSHAHVRACTTPTHSTGHVIANFSSHSYSQCSYLVPDE